jgi:hypothetical protein
MANGLNFLGPLAYHFIMEVYPAMEDRRSSWEFGPSIATLPGNEPV